MPQRLARARVPGSDFLPIIYFPPAAVNSITSIFVRPFGEMGSPRNTCIETMYLPIRGGKVNCLLYQNYNCDILNYR